MKLDLDGSNQARARLWTYYMLVIGLAGLIILLPYLGFAGDRGLDSALETCAGLCALLAGVLLLSRASRLSDPSLALVLGAALICSGLFLTGQALLWRTPIGDLHYSPAAAVAPWYWITERLTFGIIVLAALLASRRAQVLGPDNGVTPRIVIVGVSGLTIPILVYLLTSPVPPIEFGDPPVRRPIELIPIGFLLAAWWIIFRRNRWCWQTLEHWLMLSLPLHLGSELLVLMHGGTPGSATLTVAQMLRLAGHAAILIGVSRTSAALTLARDNPRDAPPTGLLRFGLRGIGLRLLTAFGAMIAGVITMTALNDYWAERDALINANKRHLNSIAAAQKTAIENLLSRYRTEAALVATRTQLRQRLQAMQRPGYDEGARERDRKKLGTILVDALSAARGSPGMALFDNNGELVTEVGARRVDEILQDYKRFNSVPWRVDMVFPDGGPVLIVNSPVTRDQRRIGNLVMLFSTRKLYEQLQSHVELGESIEALLGRIGNQGHVEIVSPLLYRPQFRNRPFVPTGDLASSMARAIAGIEGPGDRSYVDYRGKSMILATRQLNSVHWGLVVKIDEAEVLAAISALGRHHVRNGAAILLFGLVVAYVLINIFLAPLQRLVRYTEKITDGKYSYRLKNLADDEIGQLGKTLNNMACSIEQRTHELEEKNLRIETIVQTMVDGLIVIDRAGHIQSINRAVTDLFGYTSAELVGRNINMLMPEPYRSRHDGYLQRFLQTGERRIIGFARDLTAERKDGSLFPIELSVAELRIGDDVHFTGIIRDVTERLAAEEQLAAQNASLVQANEDLEQFAYIASHDLKSPLRAVDNLVQWIEEDLGDDLPEATATNMSRLKERVRRMESMIQDLLSYSRAGRRNATPEPIVCSKLVQGIVLDLDPPAGIIVEIGALPTIETPRAALETVLRNLIANAVKHHDQFDGHIWVHATDAGNYVEFTVEDDGPGISEQFHSKIFQIFQSLSAKQDGSGTGMGLALVKRLVQAGGGHVDVQSSADRRGTRFVFQWPKIWPRAETDADDETDRQQDRAS